MMSTGAAGPYAGLVNGRLVAMWRQLRDSPARDVVTAILLTAVLGVGSYGEAHPTQKSDLASFHGHHVPHTPNAALLLVVLACMVLALNRRYPVTLLCISTASVATDRPL